MGCGEWCGKLDEKDDTKFTRRRRTEPGREGGTRRGRNKRRERAVFNFHTFSLSSLAHLGSVSLLLSFLRQNIVMEGGGGS